MKIKSWKRILGVLVSCLAIISLCDIAYAEDTEYTTITVEAEDNESGVYKYALDATDESCWQDSPVFYVEPGSRHTVYVKDAAGNITSSEVYAEMLTNKVSENSESMVDDEVENGYQKDNQDSSKTAEDKNYEEGTGNGTGTVNDYVSDNSKEYYTITTTNGNAFYLIIDHRNNDSNVYFTKAVSELDLLSLAAETGQIEMEELQKQEDIIVDEIDTSQEISNPQDEKNSGNFITDNFPFILIIGIAAGAYYYFMIYKKKQHKNEEYDEDAADMEQFIPIPDEEESALFGYKGNVVPEEDTDNYLDEFYENNNEYIDDEEVGEEISDENDLEEGLGLSDDEMEDI